MQKTGGVRDRASVVLQRTGGALDGTCVAFQRTDCILERNDGALARTCGLGGSWGWGGVFAASQPPAGLNTKTCVHPGLCVYPSLIFL